MSVSTGIPSNWKLPLFWATVDGSKAGVSNSPSRALLVGQMFTAAQGAFSAAGIASPDVPIAVGSVALANQYFGRGSMLARMVAAFMASNTTQQLWCLPVAEPTAGVQATGTIAVTGPATASGTIALYIGRQRVLVPVASGDAATAIATNINAAIMGTNANATYPDGAVADLPVTSAVAISTVTLTAKWKGDTGNDIGIVPSFGGLSNGETLPAGVTLTVTAMASGSGAPTWTTAISSIQVYEFDYVGLPYTDSSTMTTWNTEYGFGPGGRWNYTRQQYGMIFNARRDTYANLMSWGIYPTGSSQNAPNMSTLAVEPDSPSPIYEWAASYCALGALGFTDDPARPLQTLEFYGVVPARLQNRFTQSQINSLCNTGFAVQATAPDGNPMIMREQTQYQLNSYGQTDTAFGLLSIVATLQTILRRMKSSITSKYPRVKLVPDGTRLGPGQAAVTPTDIKAELIAEYSNAMYDGLVADMDNFKANLVVEIDNNDPNRVNVLWPPRLAGQLRQFDVLAQFRLQYPPQPL